MGWKGLPDIDDVDPMGEQDRPVIEEVRSVLEKHDALGRFGLTLLHSHFELADDEILVECVDAENRTLTVRPRSTSEIPDDVEVTVTSWRLDTPDGAPMHVQQCFRTKDGSTHMK